MLVNKCAANILFECTSDMCKWNDRALDGGECSFYYAKERDDECTNLDAQLEALSLTPFVQENRLAIIRLLLR